MSDVTDRIRTGLSAGAAVAILALIGWSGDGFGNPRTMPSGPPRAVSVLGLRESSTAPKLRRATASWQGGRITASTGEQVTIFVSDEYGPEQAQRWADFFTGLVHGDELSRMTAYIAPLPEVQELCGDGALGCYGGDRLAVLGEPYGGVTPEEVARHEYGHHVAFHRDNAPWRAVDWGTKRWASYVNVCARAAAGTASPGDEDARYYLNPGEAFAEVYRVMNEMKAGATGFRWGLVDSSFSPDRRALEAVEQDVREPWAARPATTIRARFRANGAKSWTRRLATPLDGLLALEVTMPTGSLYDVTAWTADGRTRLAAGLWSGIGEKKLSVQVCGQRTVLIRVTRKGQPGRFRVILTRP